MHKIDRYLPSALLILLSAYVAIVSNTHLSGAIARYGWSYIEYINHLLWPANYTKDFPSGMGNVNMSLFTLVPIFLYKIGFSGLVMSRMIIILNVAMLVASICVLLRTLRPQSQTIVYFIVTALVIASSARNCDISRWGVGFAPGVPYQASTLFATLGICALLTRRYLASGIALSLSILCHPVMGMISVIFAFATQCLELRKNINWRSVLTALLIVLTVAGWFIYYRLLASPSAHALVPAAEWISLSKIMNYHWYPFSLGVLWSVGPARLLPYLAFLILLNHAFARSNEQFDRGMVFAFGCMLLLVVMGVLISITQFPFLIKLALHRGASVVLLYGLLYIGYEFVRSVQHDPWYLKVLHAFILISVFFTSHGFPFVPVAIFALMNIQRYSKMNKIASVILITVSAILSLVYYGYGFMHTPYLESVTGLVHPWIQALSCLVLAILFIAYDKSYFKRSAVAFIIFLLSAYYVKIAVLPEFVQHTKYNKDFYTLQIWARDNTKPQSLFMLAPSMGYGWRDFSRRSSLGTVREWLQNGWLYTSDKRVFDRGLDLLSNYGINLDNYTKYQSTRGYDALNKKLQAIYYSEPKQWFDNMANKYQVDYAVFEKAQLTKLPPCRAVYQNASFYLCKFGAKAVRQSAG